MSLIIFISSAVILIMAFLWLIFIRPLFKFQDHTSRDIRRTAFAKLIDIDKNLLTISSAAIILTISFIQQKQVADLYLISSWVSFLVSIVAGVLLYVAFFTHDYIDEVFVNSIQQFLNKSTSNKSYDQTEADRVDDMQKNNRILAKTIFILIYVEMTYLILALIFLTMYGYNNLTK